MSFQLITGMDGIRIISRITFIDNISGISPTVIFGNKIQKFFLVTSDVTSDIWTVTSYVTDRSPVGVYVHGRLSCLWRHHCEIIKHKVEHQQKSGNVTGRVIRKQNPRPFGSVTERDLRKQNPSWWISIEVRKFSIFLYFFNRINTALVQSKSLKTFGIFSSGFCFQKSRSVTYPK